jgi:hypothetical protein
MITCTHCRKMFIPLFEDRPGQPCTQAMDCATDIFERDGKTYMVGSFGSRVADGKLYRVLTNKYKSGIICDACITENEQDFKVINDHLYFGHDL